MAEQGGPVPEGSSYLIGEQGPEIVTFGQSGYIVPSDEITNEDESD